MIDANAGAKTDQQAELRQETVAMPRGETRLGEHCDHNAWHTEAVLEIGPHPDLSDNQRRAIEMDYGLEEGRAQIAVRRALLFYALKRLSLDTDPAARRPQDQQNIPLIPGCIGGPSQ